MGYTGTAIKGLSWVSAFRLFYRMLAFGKMLLLARLLSPQQFGEFGIAALVLALVELLTETGINVYLVQLDEDDDVGKHVDTAWVVSMIRGFLISLTVVLSSWWVVDFFNAPNAHYLVLWMAAVPLVRGFINPAQAKFQRLLRFDREFILRSIYTTVDVSVTVVSAMILKSPLALVLGLLFSALTEVVVTQLFISPRPKFRFNWKQFERIIGSGKWITSAGILSYFANTSVDTSVGKLLSTSALGLYQMSYKVSVMFVDELTELVNRVAFPVYAKLALDRARLRRAFFRTASVYIGIGLAGMAAVYALSPLIVPLLLGGQWLSIIPTVRLLTLLGVAIICTTPTNPLFLAVKKQNYLTAAILNQLIVIVIGIAIVLPQPELHRLITVAIIAMLSTLPLRSFFAYRILAKASK